MTKDLTAPEIAVHTGVCRSTVCNWIRRGYFPNAYRLSPTGDYRVPKSDVTQFLKARKVTPTVRTS